MSTEAKRAGIAATRAERAVAEALDLVDAGGLEALTMRQLADRMGLHLPAIYRLFDGKDALIDEMAEAILAGAVAKLPSEDGDWKDRVRTMAAGLRAALLAHRDGARIVGGNYAAKRSNLTFVDSLLGGLLASGLPRRRAIWATSAVFCYVLGEALEEQGATGGEVEVLKRVLGARKYVHLEAGPVEPMLDFDERFAFGLELLLAGVDALVKRP
ncbi:TetR/AcrR family transcriptional regulator C-terminal domain-containing protein [Amycolatopsis sp. VS8301801F10]|uniref:TetR/AcrR family transcriptional regulator C-terminal domain-containing protein n=1 Tax=Amycolatopsis sp. VS8301801F10 TaxID=2652442 RepID=UPI0038FCF312